MIVGVTAWRGHGATTVATLLAAAESIRGLRPWLIEADPAGGILAARLELDSRPATGPGGSASAGLEHVAFPEARHAITLFERFSDAAAEWSGVRVVTAPGDPFRAWACHLPRIPWAPLLRDLDGPVVVDLGRARGGAPNAALLAQLDVLLVVTSADLAAVVSTIEWSDSRGRVSPADAGLALDVTRVVVVDSPDTRLKTTHTDAESELGERFAAWLPWAPSAVDLVERGAGFADRRLRRQPLISAVESLADRIDQWAGGEAAA